MLSLAIDTSGPAGSLAVLRADRVLGILGVDGEETYSSRLFRQVRYLLEEMHLALADFDLYVAAAGPGSFTGLRIGLAAAKGWAEAFSKPAIGVSVLEAIAAQATTPAPLLVSLMDARRGQIFGAVYERGSGRLVRRGEEWVLAPEEVFEVLAQRIAGEPAALVSPTPEIIRTHLARSPFSAARVERVSPFLAAAMGRLGYCRAASGEASDALELDANYVRRSDAEAKWKD